jgi:hypothetical protein
MSVTKEIIDSRLKDLKEQLVQLQANAHAIGGAIQVLESLATVAAEVAEVLPKE